MNILAATQAATQTATAPAATGMDLFNIIQLFGGLALFLLGMEMLSGALRIVAGERMKFLLEKLTTNRFMAVIAGAVVTGILQSSSVTTVLLVGFITAGLMNLHQSIGVILGANIGSTFTAQIIAFKVTKFAWLFVAAGYPLMLLGQREKIKQYGRLIVGLGILFVGMGAMSKGMYPMRGSESFRDLMAGMQNPFLGLLIGALFTGLVQSSAVTTGIVIALSMEKLIRLDAAIAVTLGANIGTCVTALLASIGKPREAVRAALIHILFNIIGALLWLGLIPQLAWIVQHIGGDEPRQIANAHTLFNVINTLVFLPFVGPLAALVLWILPERAKAEQPACEPMYLDPELFRTPALALERVRLEIGRLGEQVHRVVDQSYHAVVLGKEDELQQLYDMDDDIDALHGAIIHYTGKATEKQLTEDQINEAQLLMETANHLEHIGDIVEANLIHLGQDRIKRHIKISRPTQQVIAEFHQMVSQSVRQCVQAVVDNDKDQALQVIKIKGQINRMAEDAGEHQRERLLADAPNRLEAYTLETDTLENLKRIYYFAKRIAYGVAPQAKQKKTIRTEPAD